MGAEAALGGATGTRGRRSNSSGGSTSSTCNPLQSVEEDLKKDNNTNNNVNGGGGMNDNPLSDDFRQHDDGEPRFTSFSALDRPSLTYPLTRASIGSQNDFTQPIEHHHEILSLFVICGLGYAALYVMFGDTFLPFELGWSVLLLLAGSHLASQLCTRVGLPPLIGMLLSGIVLRNLPGDIIGGMTKKWSSGIRASGLSLILLRSGLEMELDQVKSLGPITSRLTVLPACVEALSSGLASVGIFNMPLFLGLSQGFILAAVSPAVVVTGMLKLQELSIGTAKGIPSLVIAAASMDDVFAITGFSLFIGLAVPHGTLLWNIVQGPLNVIFGVVGGVVAGLLISHGELFEQRWKKVAALVTAGMALMFTAKKFHFPGAGPLASLIAAVVAQQAWRKHEDAKFPGYATYDMLHQIEHDLATIWKIVSQPLLFAVIGSEIDFIKIPASTLPKALAVTLIGVLLRIPVAYGAVSGGYYTKIEKAFIALSWLPKATVQAALASVPLELIEEYKSDDPEYLAWGEDIVTVAVVSIILTAPAGVFIINNLGPKWLSQDKDKRREDDVLNANNLPPALQLKEAFKMPCRIHLDPEAPRSGSL